MAHPSEDSDEEITPHSANREVSTNSLMSIGENYEGAVDSGHERIIEGKIQLRSSSRRLSMESASNFSAESDDSHMTSESKKKRRSSRKPRSSKTSSSKSKRKGSSSGPSYAEVDLDAANRMLEEKDIVVTSLVKQVEELQEQLRGNKTGGESDDVPSDQDLAEELARAKRLLAEQEVVTESLIEQAKIRQNQIDEKSSVIEEQKKEIERLKAKLAVASNGEGKGEGSSSMRSSKSEKKKDKKDKKSSKSNRRSSSRKLEDGEVTPSKSRKGSLTKLPEEEET